MTLAAKTQFALTSVHHQLKAVNLSDAPPPIADPLVELKGKLGGTLKEAAAVIAASTKNGCNVPSLSFCAPDVSACVTESKTALKKCDQYESLLV